MARVTMGTASFYKAVPREGVVAEIQGVDGDRFGFLGRDDADFTAGADVVARTLPGHKECELQAKTLLGELFLSILATAA